MSDGNMGNQVTPSTMEDAMGLSAIFQRAAKAIVDASEYPKVISDLQAQVDKLRQELETKSLHANQLDQLLGEARIDRDIWHQEASQALDRIHELEGVVEKDKIELDQLRNELEATKEELVATRKERDDYGMRLLAAEDQVTIWKSRAEESRKRLQDTLNLLAPDPEPEPVPEPVDYPALNPAPEPVDLPQFITKNEPASEVSAEPSAPEPAMQSEAPPAEWVSEWQPGYSYTLNTETGLWGYKRNEF